MRTETVTVAGFTTPARCAFWLGVLVVPEEAVEELDELPPLLELMMTRTATITSTATTAARIKNTPRGPREPRRCPPGGRRCQRADHERCKTRRAWTSATIRNAAES